MALVINNAPSSKPLRILPLRFVLRSLGINFPDFSGSVWHGGLGLVLAQQSTTAFRCLYQTHSESRLYALLPPMKSSFPTGETFELRLTLFGTGVEHALAVTQAIAELGRVGLRPGGHYEIIEAKVVCPDVDFCYMSAQQGFIAMPRIFVAEDYLVAETGSVNACHIQLSTPLRIKNGNEFLRNTPSYSQILRRIFSRVDQLAHVAEATAPLVKNLREELFEEAERVVIKASNTYLYGLERRSARSHQQMQFNGLLGTIDYVGEMQLTLPWLRLASITQLGGKTAFGFGGLEIKVSNSD